MAELVDALDLGSSFLRSAGSSPVGRTHHNPNCVIVSGEGFLIVGGGSDVFGNIPPIACPNALTGAHR